MSPTKDELNDIAAQAEQDLNSYQAKTGSARGGDVEAAGVDARVENKFPGSKVDIDPNTSASYNRRIAPEEGGDIDSRGRQTRGSDFEGRGGPEDDYAQAQRDKGGNNDDDVVGGASSSSNELRGRDALEQGADASRSNVGANPPGVGGSYFKGEDYYRPEDVPDSVASGGNIPPESVIDSSKDTEGYL